MTLTPTSKPYAVHATKLKPSKSHTADAGTADHTKDALRKLAERSQATDHPISTEQYGGRTTYRYTEVLNYLTRDK